MNNLEWIKSKSNKAMEITQFLKDRVSEDPSEYNFFIGSYGNPDSDIVFMPEIPSLGAKEVIKEAYFKHYDMLWSTAWKVTIGDYLFRTALYKNGFIPEKLDPLSDEPWKWGCWITDFIKKAAHTTSWNAMSRNQKEDQLKNSGKLIERELEILSKRPNPVRWVVVVGKQNYEKNFLNHVKKTQYQTDWVYHYAWPKSAEQRRKFFARFKQVSSKIKSSDS